MALPPAVRTCALHVRRLCGGINMPDGDQGRWLSYRQLGEALGCTANAVRMHAVRRGWERRSPNKIGAVAMVCVPHLLDVQPRAMHVRAASDTRATNEAAPHVQAANDAHGMLGAIRETVELLVTPLREQLEHERGRADRAEARADSAERQLAELRARPWWRRFVGQ
jgi:hypothetical protein